MLTLSQEFLRVPEHKSMPITTCPRSNPRKQHSVPLREETMRRVKTEDENSENGENSETMWVGYNKHSFTTLNLLEQQPFSPHFRDLSRGLY